MHADRYEKINLLKLSPGERILCCHRQHWTMLTFPLLVPLLILLILVGVNVFLNTQHLISNNSPVNTFLFHTYLLVIGVTFVFGTYIYLFWFYQFYIITNKRIVHRRHFTFGGRHIDEVFLDATPVKEIVRDASNPLFDLLNLEDVYIYFQRLERPEPFIFKKPEDPREIEVIMEKAAIKKFD